MKSRCHEVKIIESNHPREISSDLESLLIPKGKSGYHSSNHRHSKSLIENKSKMIDIGCLLNIEKKGTAPCQDNVKVNGNKFSRKSSPSKLKHIKKPKQKSERYISDKKKLIIA